MLKYNKDANKVFIDACEEKSMTCWICEEYGECPYPVCSEQETIEHVKREEQLEIKLEGDE
jgi:hypothetical protein